MGGNSDSGCSTAAKLRVFIDFIKSILTVSKKHCYRCGVGLGDSGTVVNLGQHKHVRVCNNCTL